MKIAVTIGDPAGIGPELVLKALPAFRGRKDIRIYGSRRILKQTAADLKLKRNYELIKSLVRDCAGPAGFRYGAPDVSTGRSAMGSLDLALQSRPDVLITSPIVKDVIRSLRRDFIGHTEYLARFYQTRDYGMLGILKDKRILLLTTHLPLRDVFKNVTEGRVREKVALLDRGLKRYFAIREPEIAVAALNPHAFEFSRGEDERILKGVLAARCLGIRVRGPFPADSLFNRPFDGFLAMYHDPAMTYLKARPGGLNFTLGLPVIRLSPLYGAALDIAGRNRARHLGLANAVRAGIKLYLNSVKE